METDTDEISEKIYPNMERLVCGAILRCATGAVSHRILNAQKKFREMGHPPGSRTGYYADCGIRGISNTPEACGRELTEYYCSDKNEVLISLRCRGN